MLFQIVGVIYNWISDKPSRMFWVKIVTCRSLSFRLCSCKNPRACISSWVAFPFVSHPLPSETSCLPPRRPIIEKHLSIQMRGQSARQDMPRCLKSREAQLSSKEEKFVQRLWYCVGGGHYKIICFHQLSRLLALHHVVNETLALWKGLIILNLALRILFRYLSNIHSHSSIHCSCMPACVHTCVRSWMSSFLRGLSFLHQTP